MPALLISWVKKEVEHLTDCIRCCPIYSFRCILSCTGRRVCALCRRNPRGPNDKRTAKRCFSIAWDDLLAQFFPYFRKHYLLLHYIVAEKFGVARRPIEQRHNQLEKVLLKVILVSSSFCGKTMLFRTLNVPYFSCSSYILPRWLSTLMPVSHGTKWVSMRKYWDSASALE